ncbi:MICOS complex subunit mic60 [Neolecta irregularis DAH-3]|uniref:MICOS complex subunit MIC60 n=1 Tax=Neolecta irregularis (strain DAH-3) TaxID=1198029 RepID=A0A1U7LLJ9_NEOID|nr:MICOS complex subunit mic60 [Neolecta irregularis DAH-3]|eukprot:OLL23391.1 MICOS complex subunit mic60 [Neolecta irregularis DAH-3]
MPLLRQSLRVCRPIRSLPPSLHTTPPSIPPSLHTPSPPGARPTSPPSLHTPPPAAPATTPPSIHATPPSTPPSARSRSKLSLAALSALSLLAAYAAAIYSSLHNDSLADWLVTHIPTADRSIAYITSLLPAPQTPSSRFSPSPIQPINLAGHDPRLHPLLVNLNAIIDAANVNSPPSPAILTDSKSLIASLANILQDSTDIDLANLVASFHEKSAELDKATQFQQQRWARELEIERENLTRDYERRLGAEILNIQNVAHQKLQNELADLQIRAQRRWNRQLKARIEQERGNRLARLDALQKGLLQLSTLSASQNALFDSFIKSQKLSLALGALHTAIDQQSSFSNELHALTCVSGKNALVRTALSSVDPNQAIEPLTALNHRFHKLAHAIKSTGLLPENSGVAGHASSTIFSKFLFRKRGLPQDNDIPSILARVEFHLENSNLDQAAREINQLSGWPRLLAQDWLTMARRHLEVKQALEIIAAEATLQALQINIE